MTAPASTALTLHESHALARPAVGLLRPIAAPAEVLRAQEETRAMIAEILKEGRDYGVIPGTDKDRRSMLKPGAERTAPAFGCHYGEPEVVEREIDHDRLTDWTKRKKLWRNQFQGDRDFTWTEESGTSRGLYRYVVRVPVIHRESGAVVGFGIGSCSTMESKYIDRPRDSENTALKMAHKRALVAACLITFGLSDQFTQDLEDAEGDAVTGEGAPKLAPMDPPCPKCAGKMWDNRLTKKSAKMPDFKCKKGKECDGVIWPPRETAKAAEGEQRADPTTSTTRTATESQGGRSHSSPETADRQSSTSGGARSETPERWSGGTAGVTFPYAPYVDVPLGARYNDGATKTRKGKQGAPDTVIACGGAFVVSEERLNQALGWAEGKLEKHQAAETNGGQPAKDMLDDAGIARFAEISQDLRDELAARGLTPNPKKPVGKATAEDADDDNLFGGS